MVVTHVITHGLFFAVIFNGYLLLVMALTSPRVWGYTDYPDVVKHKVPPQTQREKLLAAVIGLPWFIFVLGFPIFSTYVLKSKLGSEIPKFVIIPGSKRADYKDFSHHYKAHAKALGGLILVCLIIAGIVWYF